MKTPKVPEMPAPTPAPPMPIPAEMTGNAEEERKRKWRDALIEMRRKGRASTLLTGGLGAMDQSPVIRKTLLGQ